MSDGALDLSAKTEARTSPTPSITSDVGETSFNDSHERDISYPPRKLSPPDVGVGGLLGLASKMTPGNGLLTPPFSLPGGFPGFSDISQTALGLGVGVGGSSHSGGGGSAGARPFKMYPMDPLSNMFPGATGMMPAGLDPTSPFGTGLLDGSLAMSSPITQYIQQRKRRAESRMTTNNDSLEEHIARTNGKGSLPGRPRLPSPNGGNLEQGTATIQSADSSDQPNYAPVVPGEFDEIPAKLARMENGSPFSGDEGDPNERRDLAYWDRRRKNNEAAKRSRDTRRVKEEEIALRAAYLEQENLKLRAQVSILKNETQKLHFMLFNRL